VAFQVATQGNLLETLGLSIRHSFLLTGIKEKSDRWILSGYDPNIGWASELATVRKSDFKMITLTYGTTTMLWQPIDLPSELAQREIGKGLIRSFLIEYSRKSQRYSFLKRDLIAPH
jgi:hypothetical protein